MSERSCTGICRRVIRATQIALALCALLFAARAATAVEIVDLGTLGGFQSVATLVNAHGQVVGQSWTAGDAELHAFFWTPTGGMIDLGTLGGPISEATAMN